MFVWTTVSANLCGQGREEPFSTRFIAEYHAALMDVRNDLGNPATSLNKEVRPLFLGDSTIWSFPAVSSLSDYSIWRS